MNKKGMSILVFLPLVVCLLDCSGRNQASMEITRYCPGPDDIQAWQPEGEPQTAEGEDLFLLIDGGAEIYLEYGFRQAVFQTYGRENGQYLNLEIYEMDSPASAYGIYTFKTGRSGKPVDVGQDGWSETYYLNFWKGRFLVTLIGFDPQSESMGDLLAMARVVDAKIPTRGDKPPCTDLLPRQALEPNGVTYIRGNLGLFNRYEFDGQDVFALKQGVVGDYPDHTVFIFLYENPQEALQRFETAKTRLEKSTRFRDPVAQDRLFSAVDSRGRHITLKPYRHTICILLESEAIDRDAVFRRLERNIDPSVLP